jgi:hypothetical protein
MVDDNNVAIDLLWASEGLWLREIMRGLVKNRDLHDAKRPLDVKDQLFFRRENSPQSFWLFRFVARIILFNLTPLHHSSPVSSVLGHVHYN